MLASWCFFPSQCHLSIYFLWVLSKYKKLKSKKCRPWPTYLQSFKSSYPACRFWDIKKWMSTAWANFVLFLIWCTSPRIFLNQAFPFFAGAPKHAVLIQKSGNPGIGNGEFLYSPVEFEKSSLSVCLPACSLSKRLKEPFRVQSSKRLLEDERILN